MEVCFALNPHDIALTCLPTLSETVCMKGLVLTHMGQREDGVNLVKQGVRLDLTSHICWHVFGLIQKGEKNYVEALKSYTQALRFDKVRLLEAGPVIRYLIGYIGKLEYIARRGPAANTATDI